MFCSARQDHPQTYVYHLRVITAGLFEQPPIQASCMYDPEIASINGGGAVEVSEATPPPACQPSSWTAAATQSSSTQPSASPAPTSDDQPATEDQPEDSVDPDDVIAAVSRPPFAE
jgi:hypothetical protein